MKTIGYLACALVANAALAAGPALANSCQAGRLMCATAMPIGGYCECTSHGETESGTVVTPPARSRPVNSTAAGCGAHPDAPGCR